MDIILDIDGTISNCSHRRHFVEQSPQNWEAFRNPDLVMQDKLIKPVYDVLSGLDRKRRLSLLVVSGRKESDRKITENWLMKNGISPTVCYFRKDGDYRPDADVKRELLQKIREDGYNPTIVFDDRLSVCRMWAEEGLFCFCVNQGLMEF